MTTSKVLAISLVATLANEAPGQTAPRPHSAEFAGITWDAASRIVRKAHGSDNWPTTWGPDGHLYTSWGDGNGFGEIRRGLGVARLEDEPDSLKGVNLWGIEEGGYWGGKSYGMLSLHIQGVLRRKQPLEPRPKPAGALRVHPANPRYFTWLTWSGSIL